MHYALLSRNPRNKKEDSDEDSGLVRNVNFTVILPCFVLREGIANRNIGITNLGSDYPCLFKLRGGGGVVLKVLSAYIIDIVGVLIAFRKVSLANIMTLFPSEVTMSWRRKGRQLPSVRYFSGTPMSAADLG